MDESRDNIAVYVDTETKLSEKFLAGAAVRFEDYSDFGNTITGKLSARFDFTDTFALRGTVSTGFRAPGVQQLFYSQRSTNLERRRRADRHPDGAPGQRRDARLRHPGR